MFIHSRPELLNTCSCRVSLTITSSIDLAVFDLPILKFLRRSTVLRGTARVGLARPLF
jgi:hypothetical protein